MIPKSTCRLVLDTNVCLDLFVFRDRRWQRLLQSMQSGEIECVTRDDCRTEWTLVLAYDRFGLAPEARDTATAEFDRWIKPIDALLPTHVKLPICKDADDQKFIELAVSSGAAYLISKDKALLKLARRIRKLGLFEICSPEQWVSHHADI